MRHFGFIFLLFLSFSLLGQNSVQLLSQKGERTRLKLVISDYHLKSVNTPRGKAFIVEAPNGAPILKKGAPELPRFSASLIIPDTKLMAVKIVDAKYKDYQNVNIAPSKGNLTRNIDPSTVPYTYGEIYNKNTFYPTRTADLGDPYILRDFRGQVVYFYPFQYNPKTKTLRVYSEITLEVYPVGNGGKNVFHRRKPLKKIAYEFEQIYKRHFLNYEQIISKYTPLEEEGNMLVIAYDDFVDDMQDFVLWKNTIGRHTEIVPLSQVGSTAADIKNYVANYYNEYGLTYLLLVGDVQQIPTNEGSGLGGPSDNAYGYLVGNDHYQELFVGRFSAQTDAQVQTMVQRTIFYEKGDQLPSNVYNKPLGIGSNQGEGQGDDGEADYQHEHNMILDLLNYTYQAPPYELYDGDHTGDGWYDQPGDPSEQDLASAVDSGVGIINYTGHGSDLSWVTTGFSVSDVQALSNGNKLPFIWSVACVVGNFVDNDECFAESWLRHTDNEGNPIGAIAFFGSTINQSWAPPMAAQDEMVDILVESYENNIKRTFAGLSINGCFQMNDEYQDYDMTDTWTVFGDPSVTVRTDNPSQMLVSHDDAIIYGNSVYTVNCDYDGAVATISKNGQIIGTQKVSGGVANIELDENLYQPGETLTLAVFGYNKITYLTDVEVITPSGPYISMQSYSVNDTNFLIYGSTQTLQLKLKNVGVENASGVHLTLTSNDSHVSLSNNTNINLGDIDSAAFATANITVAVSGSVDDGYLVPFHLTITDADNNTWEKDFSVPVIAPILKSNYVKILDGEGSLYFSSTPVVSVPVSQTYTYNITVGQLGGNGNQALDPDENSVIVYKIENTGHAFAQNIIATLSTDYQYITIENPIQTIDLLGANQNVELMFNVSVDANAQIGDLITFTLHLQAGETGYYTDTLQNILSIGEVVEDFETGDFSAYNWNNGGDLPWEITTDNPYEGTYCAGVPDALDDNQTSSLSINLNNVPQGAKLSFYYKVSSEQNYDFFKFKVNNTEVVSQSGEVDWTYYEYTFEQAGNYTLEWSYSKDYSVSAGQDKAWIDYIKFPVPPAKSVKSRNITITATDLPSWLTLTDNGDGTALLQGVAPAQPAEFNISLSATDGNNTAEQNFTLGVIPYAGIHSAMGISIYPNPATDLLFINHSGSVSIIITDINGKIVMNKFVRDNILNVSKLSSGIYVIKIITPEKIYTRKFIKE